VGWAKTAIGFKPEYLDCTRGIRVGNLEDHQRITRISKQASRRATAKTSSPNGGDAASSGSGSAPQPCQSRGQAQVERRKLRVLEVLHHGRHRIRRFKCGMQWSAATCARRRGTAVPASVRLDWHRLVSAIQPRSVTYRDLQRLLADEFEGRQAAGRSRECSGSAYPAPRRYAGRSATFPLANGAASRCTLPLMSRTSRHDRR